jgi:hypothetical protein
MNSFSTSPPRNPGPQSARASGRSTPVLMLVVFVLGAALAGVWFKYGAHTAGGGPGLSDQTADLLHHLDSPVEIRFYSVLPPGSAPDALQDFSRRVDHLLSEFQSANGSQIRVIRNVSISENNANAAAADGIRPFNLDKGDACFLGITVACGKRKQSLAQLQPEWEPALPFDLARAILQVTATTSSPVVQATSPVSAETTNEILRLIPDVKGTSLEDGIGTLRQATVDQFSQAGAEMEKQIQAAQQELATAQNGGSAEAQQAAMKHLQQVQLEQAEKIKALAAQLQVQVSTFEQMKAAPPATN